MPTRTSPAQSSDTSTATSEPSPTPMRALSRASSRAGSGPPTCSCATHGRGLADRPPDAGQRARVAGRRRGRERVGRPGSARREPPGEDQGPVAGSPGTGSGPVVRGRRAPARAEVHMYSHILVAVDGSGPSTRAFREALRVAADLHAGLRIVHVIGLGVALAPWAEPAFIDFDTLDAAHSPPSGIGRSRSRGTGSCLVRRRSALCAPLTGRAHRCAQATLDVAGQRRLAYLARGRLQRAIAQPG